MITSLVPAGTAARVDVRALRKQLFASKLPWSEKYRNVYGVDLDIDRIADAILGARVGIMVDLTDIAREQLVMDPHLGMLGQKRMGRLAMADYTITPRTKGLSRQEKLEAKELAELVENKIACITNFRQAIYDLAWGHFDARAALEIDWKWAPGPAPFTPASLDWIHPRRLGFGPNRELRLIETFLRVGWFEPVGIAFDDIPGKFITYKPRRFGDYPEVEGLAPRSIYYSFFKRFGTRLRNVLTELFVLPWRTLTSDKEAPVQKEDMDEAVEIAEALGNQTVAAFPPGIKFEALWPGSENQGQVMQATIDDVDSQMSRLWELTDSTSKARQDAGGGQGGDQAAYNQAQTNLAFQLDGAGVNERIQADLIRWIVELNAGPDAVHLAPIFELRTAPPKDRAAEQKRLSLAIADHFPVPVSVYSEETGIRLPEDDEAYLMMGPDGVVQIVTPPGGKPPVIPLAPLALPSGPTQPGPMNDANNEAAAAIGSMLGLERGSIELIQTPNLGHGSPDVVVLQGLREGAPVTTRWAKQLADAVDGLGDAQAILRALDRAVERLPRTDLEESIERCLVRAVMIGALDAAWEAEDSEPIEAERQVLALDALGSVGKPTPGFAAMPFKEAVNYFRSKQALPRAEFDKLSAEAKMGAFTIAGLASQKMLDTAQSELTNAIRDGADLRTFKKALSKRFEDAGWTQLKPSHVENVFRNNVLGAYAVGRDRQMLQPGVLALRPFGESSG